MFALPSSIRSLVAISHVVAVGSLATPALAAAQHPTPADTTVQLEVAIEALSIEEGLRAFTALTGWRIVAPSAVAGPAGGSVTGRFTAPQALRRLLAGTPFVPVFGSDGSVMLLRDEARVQELSPLTVVGSRQPAYLVTESRSVMGTSTPLRDTPHAVVVVSRELIEDRAMRGLADVLENIPGARMGQGEGNRDQATLRGQGSTSAFFVDGMRDDVQYVRDLYNVERVEGIMGANAISFGRGVGGGVINRVTKQAGPAVRQLRLGGGSYGTRRGNIDLGAPLGDRVAGRVNAIYEHSDLFRRGVTVERAGVNPTLAIRVGTATALHLSIEGFRDERVADRGVPSLDGEPVQVDPRTFFGSPALSPVSVEVLAGDLSITHPLGAEVTLVSKTRWADYDKFYQNVFPGGVNESGTMVRLAAYNNGTRRSNLLHQTELVARTGTGAVRHSVLVGVAAGRQATTNLRRTGYFHDTATSIEVPLADPVSTASVTFRQSATDADNRVTLGTLSAYLQDQVAIGQRWQFTAGVRVERFALEHLNRRTEGTLQRTDVMLTPRAGVVFRAAPSLSLYASYGVAALPSAGDQFASLNATTSALEPETFTNHELGMKWEAAPGLALTLAAYHLDRNKSVAPDPSDPSRRVQTGSQRSRGIEATVQGELRRGWSVVAGYALQDAEITSRTSAADVGASVPLVPRHAISLWNRLAIVPRLVVGVGAVRQGDSFAALDNAVLLPGFTRWDAAVSLAMTPTLAVQLNAENLLDKHYYPTSHNNNNISPGSPRAIRITLTSRH